MDLSIGFFLVFCQRLPEGRLDVHGMLVGCEWDTRRWVGSPIQHSLLVSIGLSEFTGAFDFFGQGI